MVMICTQRQISLTAPMKRVGMVTIDLAHETIKGSGAIVWWLETAAVRHQLHYLGGGGFIGEVMINILIALLYLFSSYFMR